MPTTPEPAQPHNIPWWATTTSRPLLTPDRVRRRSITGVLGAILVTLIIVGGFGQTLAGAQTSETFDAPGGGTGHRQTVEALIGGCGARFVFNPEARFYGIVPTTRPDGRPYRQAYTTIVPMFGRHWNTPIDTSKQRFWTRDAKNTPVAENLLYNLWNGQMVIWYTPRATAPDVQRLRELTLTRPELDLIVVPWENRRGPLPENRAIALSTWGASQTCLRFTEDVLDQFRTAHPATSAPGHDGTKPPTIRANFAPASATPTVTTSTTPGTPATPAAK